MFLRFVSIGCLQKHDAFDICVDRMPAKKQNVLTHEAIGCQQKHHAFDICVDRMPSKNDTFNR